MMTAPKITLRQLDPSPALTASIEEHAAKVGELFPRTTHCEVLIEAPTKHHRHGAMFAARVDVGIPGALVVGHAENEDAHLAVKEAFLVARRRLADSAGRRRDRTT